MKRHQGKKYAARGKYALTLAVLLGLSGISSQGLAYETHTISFNGGTFAEINFLKNGESFGVKETDGSYKFIDPAQYELSGMLKDAAIQGLHYWTDMLAPKAKNNQPWQIFVTTKEKYQNASAGSDARISDGETDRSVTDHYVAQQLQEGKTLTPLNGEIASQNPLPKGDYGLSVMEVGQNFGAQREGAVDGWYVDGDTPIPTGEQAADYVGTVRHEFGHSLGILLRSQNIDSRGDITDETYKSSNGELLSCLHQDVKDPKSWNMHLYDERLNKASAAQEILTPTTFAEIKKGDPNAKEENFFIVSNADTEKNLSGHQGYAYFIGPHVTEALDGATFFGVGGLPVQSWEWKSDKKQYVFDGSHLQTAGMMSHRDYTNYTSFLEAELAVMQDLGYNLDRKAYFGRSIYNDGRTLTNTQGYSARNADGTAYLPGVKSTVPLGVGLHIYGSENTLTQAADILTEGTGATGIRVDGVENHVILSQGAAIHSDGYRGKGILVAYGRDQSVTQSGTVTANGEGGIGVQFDFGSSSNGAADEYRGSYIRYKRSVDKDTGAISSAENISLTNMTKDVYNARADELNGALVKEYNLNSSLSGAQHAIYIGKNAFVRDININKGASIQGDIVSDWKHFATDGSYDIPKQADQGKKAEALAIQYNGNSYAYNTYIPDLTTNLNINADISYDADISGPDNMRLNVNNGTFSYGGTADVVAVHVAKDAELLGGSYVLNDMSSRMADGMTDTTGVMVNEGTIGPLNADSNMNIQGNLDSTGTLQAFSGGKGGDIVISGTANIEGSKIVVKNLAPGETETAIRAKEIKGTPSNQGNQRENITPLVEDTVEVTDGEVKATAYLEDDFNEEIPEDARGGEDYEEYIEGLSMVRERYQKGSSTLRKDMMPVLYMEEAPLKDTLSDVMTSDNAQVLSAVQQNTVVGQVISDRLSTTFDTETINVPLPTNHLADGKEKPVTIPVKVPVEKENNAWVKFTKQWGDLRGGVNYHGSAISGGYDKAFGKNWRGGVFISYNSMGFGGESSSQCVYDTRFGVYAGCRKGAHNVYVYADYGWQRNDLKRGIRHLNESVGAKFDSRLIEIGGEYKYDLHAADGRIWHVSPYVNLQLSHMKQDSYDEKGSSLFNRQVSNQSNTYFAGQLGVEFKRYLQKGSYSFRVGVKQSFSGADPTLNYQFEGDDHFYTLRNEQDKTHFVCRLKGEAEFAPGWLLGGEAGLQKGSHDKDVTASVMFRRIW